MNLPIADFEILAISRVYLKRGIMGSLQPQEIRTGDWAKTKPVVWRQQMIRTVKSLNNDFVQVGALVDLITMPHF